MVIRLQSDRRKWIALSSVVYRGYKEVGIVHLSSNAKTDGRWRLVIIREAGNELILGITRFDGHGQACLSATA
jgi:hypothetical protein